MWISIQIKGIKVLNETQDLETYDIAGGICESTDYLAKDVKIPRVKKGDLFVATDVFPEEPVKKNDPIRRVKNILFSAHRAGALESAFFNMGNIVLKDMNLISKNLQPKFCKSAQPKTVSLLASKPVAIN